MKYYFINLSIFCTLLFSHGAWAQKTVDTSAAKGLKPATTVTNNANAGSNTSATPPANLPVRGRVNYGVQVLGKFFTAGSYSISWDVSPVAYQIRTLVTPSYMVKFIADYSLSETSSGKASAGKLDWNNYYIKQTFDDKKLGSKSEQAVRSGSSIVLNNNAKIPASGEMSDVPTILIDHMLLLAQNKMPSNYSKSVKLATSRKVVDVYFKRYPDETISYQGKSAKAYVVKGFSGKMMLNVWYESVTFKPVKVVFVNNRGLLFTFSAA